MKIRFNMWEYEDKDYPNNVGIDNFPKRFEKVLEMLKKQGIKRSTICEDLGLEYATLRSYYRKQNPVFPRLKTLVEFCNRYGISYKYLLHGSKYAVDFIKGDSEKSYIFPIPLSSNIDIQRYTIDLPAEMQKSSYPDYIYIKNENDLYERPYETNRIKITFNKESIDIGELEFKEKFSDFIKFLLYSKK